MPGGTRDPGKPVRLACVDGIRFHRLPQDAEAAHRVCRCLSVALACSHSCHVRTMTMSTGPSLEPLLRRLIETPQDFLDPPRKGNDGRVHVAAVVNDVLASYGYATPLPLLASLSGELKAVPANQLTLAAVMAWLVADDAWRAYTLEADALTALFSDSVPALAAEASATKYVSEPERREEFVRTTVARLGLLPEGETAHQAADRLASVSGVERRRLLVASRAAEERARAIREALARKAAAESADKWTRE